MVILGDIVQKVSGQTFEDYLQENIIDPLGMSDTMLIIPESEQAKVTGNHVRDEDGQVVVSDIFPYRRQFTPTGPLYPSITDMARLAATNLNRGRVRGCPHPAGGDLRCHVAAHLEDDLGSRANHEPNDSRLRHDLDVG